MHKLIILTSYSLLLTHYSLPVRAQLHYPEYTEAQVAIAADKVCASLNNGILKTRFEAMLLAKLSGSMQRDFKRGQANSIEDDLQLIRNTDRIIVRLNRTCQYPLAD